MVIQFHHYCSWVVLGVGMTVTKLMIMPGRQEAKFGLR